MQKTSIPKQLRRNPEVLYRPEEEGYLLFLPEKHKIFTFPKDIFEIWLNIGSLSDLIKQNRISAAIANLMVSFFKKEGLIIDEKKAKRAAKH